MDEKGYIILYNERGETIEMTKDWQIPPDAYNYIIYEWGNLVKAKNSVAGKVEFKDTDAKTVIQSATDAIDAGKIALKEGIYNISDTIVIGGEKSIILEGSGTDHTVLRWVGGSGTSEDRVAVLQVGDGTYHYNNSYYEVSNLKVLVDGPCDYIDGVFVYHADKVTLRNIHARVINRGTEDCGFNIAMAGTGRGGYFEGLSAYGWTYGFRIAGDIMVFVNPVAAFCYRGFDLLTQIYAVTLLNPQTHLAEYRALHIDVGYAAQASIINPVFEGEPETYDIYISGLSHADTYNFIQIFGLGVGPEERKAKIGVWDASWFKGIFLYGKPFENGGVATFSGDGSTTQFAIPHGVAYPDIGTGTYHPKKLVVVPLSPDAAGDFYVTVDANNIYVHYKTAPPAGTDNIKLYWYIRL